MVEVPIEPFRGEREWFLGGGGAGGARDHSLLLLLLVEEEKRAILSWILLFFSARIEGREQLVMVLLGWWC